VGTGSDAPTTMPRRRSRLPTTALTGVCRDRGRVRSTRRPDLMRTIRHVQPAIKRRSFPL
jgi:hypothetical protein